MAASAREQALIRQLDNSTSAEALRTRVVDNFLKRNLSNLPVPTGLAGGDTASQQGRYATTGGGAAVGYRRPSSRQPEPFDVRARMVEQINANNDTAGRHIADLDTTSNPDAWPGSKQAASQRVTDDIMGGMNVGGLTVWHGTPHTWEIPRFLKEKINTGEGAQAFGMGHYVAEGLPTGKSYRNDLSKRDMVDRLKVVNTIHNDYRDLQLRNIIEHGNMKPEEMNLLFKLREDDWLGFNHPHEAVEALMSKGWRDYEPLPATKQAANKLGSLYKVDLADPSIPKMIDWDTPLVNQPSTMSKLVSGSNDPDKVVLRQALDNFGKHQNTVRGQDLKGGAFMNSVIGRGGTTLEDRAASMGLASAMRDVDIPGVKFLDAASRKGGGPGTSNFVVFPGNEDLLKVLERNGQPITDTYNTWGGSLP